MSTDHIRYDLLVREALRGVVRGVVIDAAKNGLPGDHHFYISFRTRAPGVKLSPRILAQYPEEMTIVLQHQFWDLTVSETGLEVGLSFGGIPERLGVPFEAIKGFFDPSVQFGLEFETVAEQPAEAEGKAGLPVASVDSPPALANKKTAREGAARPEPKRKGVTAEVSAPIKQDGMGEVVPLDRFRKKK